MLVDPFLVYPLPGVGIIRRYEMKFLGVSTYRVSKRDYVSRQQKIERLNLLRIDDGGKERLRREGIEQVAHTGHSSDFAKRPTPMHPSQASPAAHRGLRARRLGLVRIEHR